MIEVRDLSKTFCLQDQTIPALKRVSFKLEGGRSLAICGRSGAGKSTLLHLLGGLDKPTSGSVIIDGQDITGMTEKQESRVKNNMGFVFQFHHLLKDFNILENVMMPLLIKGVKKKEAVSRALDVLQRVDIQDKKSRYPQELSGGEQQRAALARALVHNPKMILADEPTGNLDENNSRVVFELLCRLNHDLGTTLIVVTHSREYADKLDHRLILNFGEVAGYT
ncbi:MAG: ABC transporter ATP-binding protein [Deltaproteobacteria bacterium]|nr:ABC transporter ATP-binding protein [Deltaproteobacteria bacterium]